MTKPAQRDGKDKIMKAMQREKWVLFLLVLFVTLINLSINHQELTVAKSFSVGALLSYIGHLIFAVIVFRYHKARAGRQIVNHLYLGAMLKWMIALIGFAMVFIFIKPLSAVALFVGYLIMQVANTVIMWKVK